MIRAGSDVIGRHSQTKQQQTSIPRSMSPASVQAQFSPTQHSHPHLNETELAERWGVSVKKIQRDRLVGAGVPFLRLGRAIRYRMSDILAFEQASVMMSTSSTSSPTE